MQTITCADVRPWITLQDRAAQVAVPPQELCEHVAQCATCRGSLLLLMTELLGVTKDVQDITCEMCQADLSSYIDREHMAGVLDAIEHYPHVWWHLWTCVDCAETYRLTTMLLDDEPIAVPSYRPRPHQTVLPTLPRLKRLHVPRSFLNGALNVHSLFGYAMGSDDGVVLIEEEASGYQINVDVRKQSDSDWIAIITVTPPVAGLVYLTLGATVFPAQLSVDGKAVISAIPSVLLIDIDGPDMTIELVPEAVDGSS